MVLEEERLLANYEECQADQLLTHQMEVVEVVVIVVQVVQVAHQLPHRAMVAQVVEVLEDQTA
jgi:hypothetical protein